MGQGLGQLSQTVDLGVYTLLVAGTNKHRRHAHRMG
jgi:hypothetical protein